MRGDTGEPCTPRRGGRPRHGSAWRGLLLPLVLIGVSLGGGMVGLALLLRGGHVDPRLGIACISASVGLPLLLAGLPSGSADASVRAAMRWAGLAFLVGALGLAVAARGGPV